MSERRALQPVEAAGTDNDDEAAPVLENGADFLPALLGAARYFGRHADREHLLRGLPVSGGRLGETCLEEAAQRVRLLTGPRQTSGLRRATLPVIVATKTGGSLALLKRDGDGFIASDGGEPMLVRPEELPADGDAAFFGIRPEFHFDHRSLHYDLPKPTAWLSGPLRENAWIYGFAAIGGFAINITAVTGSMFSMAVYDRVIPNNSMSSLVALTVGALLVLVGELVLKFIRAYLIDTVARRFDVKAGASIFAQMLSVAPEFRSQSSGSLVNLVREFESIREFLSAATLVVVSDLPFVAIFLFLIFLIGGPLVFVPVIGICVMIVTALLLQWPLSASLARSFREASQKAAFLHEAAAGIDTLKTANAQSWARRHFEHLIAQNAESNTTTRRWSLVFATLSGSITSLVTIATVAYGALLVSDGIITSGAIIAAVLLSGRAMAPFAQVTGLLSRWQQTRLAVSAINGLMNAPGEDHAGANQLQRFPIKGAIAFRDTGFSYPQISGMAAPNARALDNISFDIPIGQTVGIIGRVGSGKSTLLKLLVRLNDPSTGNVKIDGVDVRQIHPAELRGQIGYAGQDSLLFHGTIRDNIVIGRPGASDQDILDAAEIAGLGEVLQKTALGLGAPVGERGALLSGGQRQAVAIARALVGNPPILLLDEPTSMMDNTTEAKVIAGLGRIRQGKTTVIVTHRPQVLPLAERLLVVEGGKIVADGPRDNILKKLSARPGQQPTVTIAGSSK